MVVLRAIGRFFKKIWDWIKQTAWIQPLLIVGIIFGVIFSIPSIVSAIDSAKQQKEAADTYFFDYKLTLEGEKSSAAYKISEDIQKVADNSNTDLSTLSFVKQNETKFFLVYLTENCSNSTELKDAFKYMKDRWNAENSEFVSEDGKPFVLHTIYLDEKTTAEDSKDKSTAELYIDNFQKNDFFSALAGQVIENDYSSNNSSTKSKIEQFCDLIPSEASTFKSLAPAILLVDLNVDQSKYGVRYESGLTEMIFGSDLSTGESSTLNNALKLMHCWNHSDEFDNRK